MTEEKKINLLDFLILIVKWKTKLLIVLFSTLIISYLFIYLFIDEKFEASALIVPSDQEQSSMTSLLKNISGIPLSLGGLKQKSGNIDLYTTIIYSRTNLDLILDKFNLQKEYGVDKRWKALKILKDNISTTITEETAFEIKVTDKSPQKASEIANFIIQNLNSTIISLNIKKAHDNRIFLEGRFFEIKKNLALSEDSLRLFQQKSGVFIAEDQIKASILAYTKLESDLSVKQSDLTVLEKILGENSPAVEQLKLTVAEYRKSLEALKNNKGNDQILMSLSSLPAKTLHYLRLFRDVKIYNEMLEFVIPLYEQSKYDEQKEIPILQVIDYAVPPEKRSFPPRVILSLLVALACTLFTFLFLSLKENKKLLESDKFKFIRKNLFRRRIIE
jgi:capsule polysaccharide export protein KpsE/RkpR